LSDYTSVQCCVLSVSLRTCVTVVFDGFDDVSRGEVGEGKAEQVRVDLNVAGGYINGRLPFLSTGNIVVRPMLRGLRCGG